jgi:Xaa-Pro aminopeptidase
VKNDEIMSTIAKPPRGFTDSEYQKRSENAQHLMSEQGIDAIVLTTEPDIRYFTGFFTRFWQSPTRPWFVILPKSGKPIAVIPSIGLDLMSSCWVSDIRTWTSPNLQDDGVSLLTDTLLEIAGTSAKIGIPMGHETHLRMPLNDFTQLKQKLKAIEFVDAHPILSSLQLIKSDEEIAKIRYACGIADKSFARVSEIAFIGEPLGDIFRNFQRLLLEEGADWVPYLAGGAGQGGYRDVISPTSDVPLTNGDVLMLDTGAFYDGYFCDFDRNYAISYASDETNAAYQLLFEATDAGINSAQIGRTASDVYAAIAEKIALWKPNEHKSDEGDVGRLGHGLGMRLTEWPSLISSDQTVLQENMILTIEPSMTISPGSIMVHEENILITKNGPELLSKRAPSDIPIIG